MPPEKTQLAGLLGGPGEVEMAIVFLSHSSYDNAAAAQVRRALLDGGYEAVFLDIDEVAGIHPGSRWRDELSRQLRTADAVVYLGSSNSERSVWCTAELAVAKALEKLILPVQIETGARHELLTDDQWVMYRSTVDDALTRLIHELDRSPDTLAHRRSWDNRRSPFPGLRPFTDADAGVFFGRDAAIEELVRLTNPVSLLDHGSLVAVVGPSGTGKSSLVRAGLIPNLSAQRPPKATWLVIPPIVPSSATRRDLGRAFAVAGAEPALADSMGRGDIGLSDAVETLARMRTPPVDRVLIVLDQAEELFAQPDRLEVLQMLLDGARAGSGCRVVVTVREGYFSRLFSDVEIAGRVVTLPLSPLDRPALAAVIEGPAERADLSIEAGFVQYVLDDVHTGEALPLLALALERTYRSMASDGARRLTQQRYGGVGGVAHAVANQAAEAVARLQPDGEDRVVRFLTQFVNVDDEGQWTRRARDVTELPDDERLVLAALEAANLVVVDKNGNAISANVAHSTLFTAWPPLDKALAELGDNLRFDRRVERDAAEWAALGRPSASLPAGLRFREIDHQYGRLTERSADADTDDYIRHARRAELKRRRRKGALLASALGLMLVAGALGVGQLQATSRASEARRLADARGLMGRAASEPRFDLSFAHGLQAYDNDSSREMLEGLVGIVAREPLFRGYLGPPMRGAGRTLWWNESDELLVGDAAGGVRSWSPSGIEQTSFASGGPLVRSVVQAGAGWVAWADIEGHIYIHRGDAPIELRHNSRPAHVGPVADLVIVDDRRVLSAADDGVATLWDVVDGRQIWSTDIGSPARSVAGLPGGSVVVIGTHSGEVVELDSESGQEVSRITVGESPIRSLAVIEQGVATGDDSGVLRVLPTRTDTGAFIGDEVPSPLYGGTGAVRAIAAAGAGRILTGWTDGSIRLLNDRGQLVDTFDAHGAPIRDVAFDPRTQWFAATGDDGLVSRWDLSGASLLVDRRLSSDEDLVGDVDELGRVYVGGTDQRLSILDPGGTTLRPLSADLRSFIVDVDVADDGSVVGVALANGTAQAVSLETGDVIAHLDVGDRPAHVAVSGDILVAAGDTVRTVNIRSGEERELSLPEGITIASMAAGDRGNLVAIGGSAGNDGAVLVTWRDGADPQSALFGSAGLAVNALDVDPEHGKVVIGRNDGRAEIWDAEPLTNSGVFFARHSTEIYDVRFVPSASSVVSVDGHSLLWAWSAEFGTSAAAPIDTGLEHARRVIPDADGTHVTIVGARGVAVVNMDAEQINELACELVGQGCS